MRTAAWSLNAAALAALALPAWLIFDALGRQPGQTWQGVAFVGLALAGMVAWALAAVLLCRPRPGRASPLVLTGGLCFAAAFAVVLLAG